MNNQPANEKLPDTELKTRLAEAADRITVGARYTHYKNHDYTVLDLVIIEATDEVGVIYRAEYGSHLTFMRPAASWLETVEVDGRTVPRFRKS